MLQQHTIGKPVTVEGVGLHSGKPVRLTIGPAPAGTGIVFRRSDLPGSPDIPARITSVAPVEKTGGRQTTLQVGTASVMTVEHLLAACSGLGIDNAYIEVSAPELPALDGSALPYVEAIHTAGRCTQDAPKQVFEVTAPITITHGDYTTVIVPAPEFRVSYTLSYRHPSLTDQYVSMIVNEELFVRELAPARTFCLKEEVDQLLARGYGKGASYDNTLVFVDNKPLGTTLRFPDEAGRHKVVDLIGDLYLLGCAIKGHVITSRTGHSHNVATVQKLVELQTNKQGLGEPRMTTGRPVATKMDDGTVSLDINQIIAVLPHRYPFLLIDRIVGLVPGKRAIGIKNVTFNEPFFQGHFPGHPIMPGVLIIEAMAQVGGIVTLYREDGSLNNKLAYFMSIDGAKFRAPVTPGDQLRIEVNVLKSKGRIGVCEARAFVEDKLVCEAEVKFTIVDR